MAIQQQQAMIEAQRAMRVGQELRFAQQAGELAELRRSIDGLSARLSSDA